MWESNFFRDSTQKKEAGTLKRLHVNESKGYVFQKEKSKNLILEGQDTDGKIPCFTSGQSWAELNSKHSKPDLVCKVPISFCRTLLNIDQKQDLGLQNTLDSGHQKTPVL